MKWIVNGEDFQDKIVVGDTLEVNGLVYTVLAINEDGIVVKELQTK